MDENEDAKLFLRDAGKTAEETVERVRGFEENSHYLLHRMILALPWLDASVAETLYQYAEEDFEAALQFARDLQQAGDFQQAVRLQMKYADDPRASPDLKIKNSPDKISCKYQLRERSVNKYLRWHDQISRPGQDPRKSPSASSRAARSRRLMFAKGQLDQVGRIVAAA